MGAGEGGAGVTSELETAFESYIRFLAPDLPAPVREHRFAPPRRWRFDFAWPAATGGVAVELDGGAYTQGRHTRGAGFEADCEKLNEAAVRGWRVLRFTSGMLTNDPEGVIAQIRTVLEGAQS